MLYFASECTVWQTTEQNVDIKRESNFVDLKVQHKNMKETLLGKMATDLSKLFNLESPHNQIWYRDSFPTDISPTDFSLMDSSSKIFPRRTVP